MMPVTVPVTIYIPDVPVRRVSLEKGIVVAECEIRTARRSGTFIDSARTALQRFPDRRMIRAIGFGAGGMRALEPEALQEFLRVNRTDGVAAYVQKYGLFNRRGRFYGENPTTQYGLTPPERIEGYFRVDIEEFKREQKLMRGLLRVWTVLKEGELDDASEIARELELDFASDPYETLSMHLSGLLAQNATLRLIATSGKLEPILKCEDVLTGLYGLLFQAVVAGRPWVVCLNCQNAFAAGRVGKKFCNERCQQTYKQRRYRSALGRKKKRYKGRS